MAVACQGLRGNLVIFLSMFRRGGAKLHTVLMESTIRGNKEERRTDSRRESMTENGKMGWWQLFL